MSTHVTAEDLLVDAFGRVRETCAAAIDALSGDDLAWRPDAEANPIGWLVWHLARVQDDHVAGVAGLEQVWTRQGYAADWALPYAEHEIGYGHSSEQVGALRVEAEPLLAYLDAVQAQTLTWLGSGQVGDLGRIVDERWDPPVTLAVRLVSVVDDCIQHAGQAAYVRGLLERRG